MRYYHGTTDQCLERIRIEGLQPQPSHDNPGRVAVYLTDDPAIASDYAELAVMRRGGVGVVLEIDASAVDITALEPDDYDLQTLIDDPEYARDCGVAEIVEGYTHWLEMSWEDSLKACFQVAYMRAISPGAVCVYEPNRCYQPA